ncbi:MAG: sensor histidine kinase [Chloroflexi bacterium]|nr:sensor histidine kinase [Chloroflexota bacterium]
MAEFFQTNRIVVYFVYGEAFFILGLAIALQSRKHSQLPLANRLWILAVFGIVHAFYEWGTVFIPIQTYLPATVTSTLQIFQVVLGAISFLALFQFGVELVILSRPSFGWLSMMPPIVFVLWAMGTLLMDSVLHYTSEQTLILGEVLARYGLAVPGAAASAWGLWQQARQVRAMELPKIARYFHIAGYAFAIYAALGAIVPRANFFPANVLNYDLVLTTIGVPVPVFRAALGGAIAYLIIRGLEIFDVETDRLLEEVAQARAVAADRERIGRELHDSIIQSLYAAGLMLEDATLTIDEDKARAQGRIRGVIDALNRAIRDIRRYVLDLRGESNRGDLETTLEDLARTFRLETLIDTEFHLAGSPRATLSPAQSDQVLTIVREALTNVRKHARATHAEITVSFRPMEMELSIADNGIGFASNGHGGRGVAGEHQGLRNMQARARIIGAQLVVDSAPGRGTTVRLIVPTTERY